MKLPESFTKPTLLSKILAGLLFITLPFVVFYLGIWYQTSNAPKTPPQKINKENNPLEKELNYCLENKAIIGQERQEAYSFTTFGLTSPTLENLQVVIKPYEYKRNTIENKEIYGKEKIDNHNWGISSWYLKSYKGYLSDLQNNRNPMSIKNFPIFDGYEFIDTPKWLSDRIEQWNTSGESYTSLNGIKMYWAREGMGSSVSTFLEFFQPYPPSGKPTLYLIWVNENYSVCNPIHGFGDPCVLKEQEASRQVAKKIADTLNLR